MTYPDYVDEWNFDGTIVVNGAETPDDEADAPRPPDRPAPAAPAAPRRPRHRRPTDAHRPHRRQQRWLTASQAQRQPGRRSAFRRQAVAIVVLLGISGVAVAGWVAGTRIQSPAAAAAKAPRPTVVDHRPGRAARAVGARRHRGDVVPGASTSVSGPSSQNATIVTGVFVAVGDELYEGDRIVEVSGRPVFVFEGAVPAFRTMRPGMQGLDVDQLQAGLGRLGCDTSADGGLYGEITKRCVAAGYDQLGYPAEMTADDEEEKLNTAAEAVSQAEAQLADAEKALAEATKPPTALELATEQIALDAARRKTETDRRAAVTTAIDSGVAIDGALLAINAELAKADATPGDRQKAQNELAAAVRKAAADAVAADEAIVVADEALLLAEAKFDELTTVSEAAAGSAVEKAQADLARTQRRTPTCRRAAVPRCRSASWCSSDAPGHDQHAQRQGRHHRRQRSDGSGRFARRARHRGAAGQLLHRTRRRRAPRHRHGRHAARQVSGQELHATLTSLGEQIETSSGSNRGFPAVIRPDEEIPDSGPDATSRSPSPAPRPLARCWWCRSWHSPPPPTARRGCRSRTVTARYAPWRSPPGCRPMGSSRSPRSPPAASQPVTRSSSDGRNDAVHTPTNAIRAVSTCPPRGGAGSRRRRAARCRYRSGRTAEQRRGGLRRHQRTAEPFVMTPTPRAARSVGAVHRHPLRHAGGNPASCPTVSAEQLAGSLFFSGLTPRRAQCSRSRDVGQASSISAAASTSPGRQSVGVDRRRHRTTILDGRPTTPLTCAG